MHLKNVVLNTQSYPATDAYPFGLPIFRQTESLAFETPVTLFVGENGTGKSTLLEAIAVACGIHIWRNIQTSKPDRNPYEYRLHQYLTVQWSDGRVPGSFFGSKIFQHFAELLDEWAETDCGQLDYFGGKSLTTQSHGQSLMSFFRSRYAIKGLYLLDEPETALSPRSQIDLLHLIAGHDGNCGQAQFIIATHSPILLACPDATIYTFDHASVRTIRYEETDHYRLYRNFLEDRNRYLKPGDPDRA
ncbi:MAG: hypothetical protein CSYNP_04396 [Syntrophus sp. SKADARSKE-3]|nr:hypothetical protein [Syntrophus sp. SKADARSKE-3]